MYFLCIFSDFVKSGPQNAIDGNKNNNYYIIKDRFTFGFISKLFQSKSIKKINHFRFPFPLSNALCFRVLFQ